VTEVPTIKDIAKHLKVSVSTVSRALNNHPDIREETKQEVMEAVKRFNYTPNALARGLIQRRSLTVGLMIPDITDPFFSALAHDVEDVLSESGYQVFYGNTSRRADKEKRFLTNAIERQMDGLIVTPDFMDEETVELLQRMEAPIVFLRRRPPAELKVPFVDVDHYRGACDAIRYLLELGHTNIGFIGMPEYSFTGQERRRGVIDTLTQHGIDPAAGMIVAEEKMEASGYEAMGKLMAQFPAMTAVFAANDTLGIGALEWLAKNDVAVPGQMSVIGFDNLEATDLFWIKMTTVAQPRKEMGRKAAELLIDLIQHGQTAGEPILLDTELVVRRTCAKLGAKL
jgi:LacI family transcriptional regulator